MKPWSGLAAMMLLLAMVRNTSSTRAHALGTVPLDHIVRPKRFHGLFASLVNSCCLVDVLVIFQLFYVLSMASSQWLQTSDGGVNQTMGPFEYCVS